MREKLKKCPFCGGKAIVTKDVFNDNEMIYVICENCWANSGFCDKEDKAIRKWNKRTNPWHTGTPTEGGLYLVVTHEGYDVWRFNKNFKAWNLHFDKVKAWMPIPPFEANKDEECVVENG